MSSRNVTSPRPKKKPPTRRAAKKPEQVRETILAAFSQRAKRAGIRSVVMGELASELRMSASTLYGHFASKEDLVAAMVDAWSEDLASHDVMIEDEHQPVLERFMIWCDAWSLRIIQYSPAFWGDLARDYPALYRHMQRELDRRKAKGEALLLPYLRPELPPRAAFALLDLIYTESHDPRRCDEIGVSRRDAIRAALSIWATGALVAHKAPHRARPTSPQASRKREARATSALRDLDRARALDR